MSRGFTLVELMIVVAIIGIIAAMAVPQYEVYVAKSQVAEISSIVNHYKSVMIEHVAVTGKCPSNRGTAVHKGIEEDVSFIPDPKSFGTKYIDRVIIGAAGATPGSNPINECGIWFVMKGDGVSKPLQNTWTVYRMKGNRKDASTVNAKGSTTWFCASHIKPPYLPHQCVHSMSVSAVEGSR